MSDDKKKKRLPILIIPGIMSSGLEVVKSRNGDHHIGERVWMNPTAIGFGAMYTGRAEETVLNPENPKNLLRQKGGRFRAFCDDHEYRDGGESDHFDDDDNDGEAEHELYEPPKGVSKDSLEEGVKLKSSWLDHLSLSDDMVHERSGNEIRPIPGLDGVDFLTDIATIKVGASYVFGPIIKLLTSTEGGYTREKDLDAATYDWRVPPGILEERDGYFTKTLDRIEKMYTDSDGTPVVLLCHSMGCKCGHYLLNFAKKHRGRDWLDKYIHSYMPVGGPHIGAPATISMAFNPTLNPMLDPMLRNEERLIFGRSLGSGPWLMPRFLPTSGVSAPPCLFCKREGLLEISIKDPLGDCDALIRTKHGTREMDSLKLFLEFGGGDTGKKKVVVHSKPTPIMKTLRTENKESKFFAFEETFQLATPPTLEEEGAGLPSFALVLKQLGTMRAHELEKKNMAIEGLRLLDRNRGGRLLVNHAAKKAQTYGTVIGRSTKQCIDINKLLSSTTTEGGFEMDLPVTIHARVDMHLTTLEPKEGSRSIQTTVHIKWTPPLSSEPPPLPASSSPVAVLQEGASSEDNNNKAPLVAIESGSDPKAVYTPISGSTIFRAEGLETALGLVDGSYYEKDDIGPRTTSAVDAPPVKRVMAVYGVNLPTQVSAVCCRRPVARRGPGLGVSSEFVVDKSSSLSSSSRGGGYEIDDGQINETSKTPQKDILTGETIHRSGDGTVPYYSLQQCQVWKKEGSCDDVQIEEIEGAEHRAILADERFHRFLLNYVMG